MFSYEIDENLKLVLPSLNNAESVYAAVRENLEPLKMWMPWATDEYSVESAHDFIRTNLIEYSGNGMFAACIVFDERIIGTIGLHHFNASNKSVQLGYWLAKNAQGKASLRVAPAF